MVMATVEAGTHSKGSSYKTMTAHSLGLSTILPNLIKSNLTLVARNGIIKDTMGKSVVIVPLTKGASMTTQGMLELAEELRIERDIAQSACTAWRYVFENIEAHLQDRIAMRDQSSPETYLSIIRSAVENVYRDSHAIVNARWADSACHQR